MNYNQHEVVKLLKENAPIAICDGNQLQIDSFFEIYMGYWLEFQKLEFKMESELYFKKTFDLSVYKTIFFTRFGGSLPNIINSFEDILKSFSKENLKLIIVGSDTAYYAIKDLAEKLKILIIGCNMWDAWAEVEQLKEDYEQGIIDEYPDIRGVWKNDFPKLFFDPKQRWTNI